MQRATDLSTAELISAQQFDEASFDYKSHMSVQESLSLEIAEIDHAISLSEIRAPFSGIVARKLSEVGQWLKVGDPLLTMVSLDRVEVIVDLPEFHLNAIRLGLKAKVEFEALGGAVFSGAVTAILPEALSDARTFAVHVSVDNPKLNIRAGMLGLVNFQPSNERSSIVVRRDALVRKE